MIRVFGYVIVLLVLLPWAACVDIDTTDGGYKDITVSISEKVPPNEYIIEDIKALFKSSSVFLHKATGGRVYFKHVNIRVPNTWPERSGARAFSSNTFYRSDVRVDLAANPDGDVPYTEQLKPCGLQGEYIQLTPGFLATVRNPTAMSSLVPAHTFVHEWAHFRYGVFDEYGSLEDDRYPLTYCYKTMVRGNACSKRIRFLARLPNDKPCYIDHCRIQLGCKVTFYNPAKDPVESSVMFMPPVKNVSHFCEDAGPRKHNWHAPNKQNYNCKQQSSWAVIVTNDDFKGRTRVIDSKEIQVTFDEEQQRKSLVERVVLVLDVSSSMLQNDRMAFLKEATQRYIKDIEDGSRRLAIVVFSDDSKVVHPLKMVDVNTKQGFLNAVTSIKATGSTCIACGLKTALKVLRENDEAPEGAFIILMTDGEGNRGPIIEYILPSIVANKVIVSTVALTAAAERSLETVALETRGKAFGLPDLRIKDVALLKNLFVSSTTAQYDSTSLIWMLVDEDRSFKRMLEVNFTVDPSLGSSTLAHVRKISGGEIPINAILVDPTGRPCQPCSETMLRDETAIEIPTPAMAGTWKLQVRSSTSDPVNVSIWIKSEPRKADSEPFRASSEVVTFLLKNKPATFVYVKVTKAKKVVLGAVVFAEFFRPTDTLNSRHSGEIRLQDDGLDPDVHANDGTYSGYFTHYVGTGRYIITASVSSQGTTRLADPPKSSGRLLTIASLALPAAPNQSCFEPSDSFPISCFRVVNRSTTTRKTTPRLPTPRVKAHADDLPGVFSGRLGGATWYATEDIHEEHFPPGDIKDLAVTHVAPGKNNTFLVRLEWTWPGAHLTNGIASGLDLRAAKRKTDLEKDFEKQIRITKDDVVVGHLDPLVARSPHSVTFRFPRALYSPREDRALTWNVHMAAQVYNSDGLRSDTSNIAWASYVPPDKSTTAARTKAKTADKTTAKVTIAPTATTAEGTAGVRSRLPVSSWFWILYGSFAAALLFAILVAVLRVLKTKENQVPIPDGMALSTTTK